MNKYKSAKTILILLLAILLALPFPVWARGEHKQFASTANDTKIATALMSELAENDTVEALVYLKERAEPAGLARQAQQNTPASATAAEKRRKVASAVVAGLQEKSQREQASLLRFLQTEKRRGTVQEINPYYIANVVYVKAEGAIIEQIASRNDVDKLYPNSEFVLATSSTTQAAVPDWNLNAIQAPQSWSSFGLDGSGIVVGVLDSGVNWQHEALKTKWRGYNPADPDNPDPIFNWFDAVQGQPLPYDINGHGTHVTGIIVGSTPQNPIGVAPGAQWIAAQAFNNNGRTTTNNLLAAGEYLLAPTDANGVPNPDKAPDIINCSWGSTVPDQDRLIEAMVATWHAAGIFPVFAAGNEGNDADAGTITYPAYHSQAFAVGSVNQSLQRAPSSGEGPGPDSDLIKPDVAAPGVNIRSSLRNGSYGYMSGTSMAAPHVAGAAALLRSANPDLTPEQLETVLKDTALPLTDSKYSQSPNYGYGFGLIQAQAALQQVVETAELFGISFPFAKLTLALPGPSTALQIDYQPYNASPPTLLWHSSNPETVSVTDGQITPHKTGTAVVSAQTQDGQFFAQVEVTVIPAEAQIKPKVVAGFHFSAALLSDGTVWAWGANNSGQLGHDSVPYNLLPQKVNLAGVQDIAAGDNHLIALLADGTVRTWGDNSSGQLGTNDTISRSQPYKIPNLAQIVAIAAGDEHSLAIKSDGTVWAWGSNNQGQLGDGTTHNRTTPVKVHNLSNIIAVDGGWHHSLALRADGTVWSWGSNDYGQLGDGTHSSRLQPVAVKNLTAVTSIAAGSFHSLALDQGNNPWSWGDNYLGQLGYDTFPDSVEPQVVNLQQPVVSIAAGYLHTFAQTQAGTLYGWGVNNRGQLGTGTAETSSPPLQVNTPALQFFSAGVYHSLAVGEDGYVYSWGSNEFGELADGSQQDRHAPTKTALQSTVPSISDLALNKEYVVLTPGERTRLYAAASPYNVQDISLSWHLADPHVATVSGGLLTAKSEGTTQVTVTASSGQTATSTIIVTSTPGPVHQVTLSSQPTNGGQQQGAGLYLQGSTATITAQPALGYYFQSWSKQGNIVSTNPSYSFTVQNNVELVANFATSTMRLFGRNRFATAVAISQDSYPENSSADVVVIARSDDFADALPGGVLAYQHNGPLLLTHPRSLSPEVSAEIARVLKAEGTIYILGGTGAVSAEVEEELSSLGDYTIKRLSGTNRIATAAKIAAEVGAHSGKAIVATHSDFPDALAISSYAAAQGIPILLTHPRSLSPETAAYLSEHNPEVVVVGGDGVVSTATYQQISAIVNGRLQRIGGRTRFDTAVLIAQEFFAGAQTATLVNGQNFPDALTGGVNAARYNAPILLARALQMPQPTTTQLTDSPIRNIVIYGGSAAISYELEELAKTLLHQK